MAIIKCKMCGGDLVLVEGSTVATCEFCGSQQTVPTADNEKKLTLFARANRLRAACDFDKAAGIYESIVADFSDEAEAYWGLVLCKYGIEYVDDPGTGKKIPTCHRSSFDSVMDDANFEQAMENAHMEAQKVYRDEAKQFERIRKGILEVSSTEKPYDIFICYKETAPNGDRTLDSVLAQDLYSALTDKGYRVFFSRITLQGKLGEAFEPYIFAALNSAKVMLAVGTSYEYYNAVWVKNEWSRYLKICEADKSKHLIPCYKDLDPEDMPKEFNHLQGADLGKMGAIQDILFNMEKYIPLKKQNTTVIQERVVVGGSGNNKIASLLDRGNMALEDGDWAKADSFFEDVLNNDSKNAQAYLGKTLAMEKCRTIDAFARKRKDATQNVRGAKLSLSPNQSHIDSAVERFRLRGYVDEQAIRKLYTYDLSYHSDLAERQQQYRNEEKYWADHKWLSKAEKFAVGAVAEHLETEKKALFSALAQRVKQAEAAEAAAKKDVQARYEAHLLQADEKAEALFEDGRKRREADYQKLLMLAKNSADVAELTEAAGKFDDLGDYQDSKNLAGHCRKRAAEEQAKLDAEAEVKRIAKEKAAEAQKAKNKMMGIIAAAVAVVVIAAILVTTNVIIPGNKYKEAEELLANGNTAEAAIAFGKLGSYKDAQKRSAELWTEIVDHNVFCASSFCSAVTQDGTVVSNDPYGLEECDFSGWTDVIAIESGHNVTYGLRADGTVLVAGTGGDYKVKDPISTWTDVAAISADMDLIAALKYDGTVELLGTYTPVIQAVNEWENIIGIMVSKDHAGHDYIVGIKTDGTIVSASTDDCKTCNIPEWTNIKKILSDGNRNVGLRNDGTVVVSAPHTPLGVSSFTENDISQWTGITDIAFHGGFIVGLLQDGTVVSAGNDLYGACDVSSWSDIVRVYATFAKPIGLTTDGRLVFDGSAGNEMEDWPVKAPEISPEEKALHDAAIRAKNEALAAAYAAAEELLQSGDQVAAAMAFGALEGYNDAITRSMELWDDIAPRSTLSAGRYQTIAIATDGSVVAAFDRNKGSQSILDWDNIVSVATGFSHSVGLKADGTVVAAGGNYGGECDVSDWRNIVAISAGYEETVGLKADGTIVVAGEGYGDEWNRSEWTDLIAVSTSGTCMIGLKADGTVVAAGDVYGTESLSDWNDIIAVAAGSYHVIGLKADGTVVAAGWNNDYQCNVQNWTNIVAISAGNYHTVGLKKNGTLIATGDNDGKQCNVTSWQNVAAISAGGYHTVALKYDGTAMSVGGTNDNESGRCNVSGWNNIKLPN